MRCSDGSSAPPLPAVPRPRRPIVASPALVDTVSVAPATPTADGLNAIDSAFEAPAGMLYGTPGVVRSWNSAAPAPPNVTLLTTSLPSPVFVTVTVFAALAAPPATSLKTSRDGLVPS